LTYKWIKNVVYTYNGILFSLKKKEILTQAPTWMNLKDISYLKPSRTSSVQSHLYSTPRTAHFIEMEVEWWLREVGGKGGLFNGCRLSFVRSEDY
jgi:hypothetical protein